MSYWYNTATGQVETDDTRGQAQDVMGPYETEAEAALRGRAEAYAGQPSSSARSALTFRSCTA